RRHGDGDQAAQRPVRSEVGQADPSGVGQQDSVRQEADQGELFIESSADVQRTASGEAVDDLLDEAALQLQGAVGHKSVREGRRLGAPSRLSGGCGVSLLEAREVGKRYGPVVALESANLAVDAG